jgi:hypothetical protein
VIAQGKNVPDMLSRKLNQIAELLHKYGHHAQGAVVDSILDSIRAPEPDYKELAGIEMWGGAGAVWEVLLTPSSNSREEQADKESFQKAIVAIADAMDQLGIGTDRSRFIAKTFQGWLDKGL